MKITALFLTLTLAGCASDIPRPIREAPTGNIPLAQALQNRRNTVAWRYAGVGPLPQWRTGATRPGSRSWSDRWTRTVNRAIPTKCRAFSGAGGWLPGPGHLRPEAAGDGRRHSRWQQHTHHRRAPYTYPSCASNTSTCGQFRTRPRTITTAHRIGMTRGIRGAAPIPTVASASRSTHRPHLGGTFLGALARGFDVIGRGQRHAHAPALVGYRLAEQAQLRLRHA